MSGHNLTPKIEKSEIMELVNVKDEPPDEFQIKSTKKEVNAENVKQESIEVNFETENIAEEFTDEANLQNFKQEPIDINDTGVEIDRDIPENIDINDLMKELSGEIKKEDVMECDDTTLEQKETSEEGNCTFIVPFEELDQMYEEISIPMAQRKSRYLKSMFRCLLCDLKSTFKKDARKHAWNHKNMKILTFDCALCENYQTTQKNHFSQHLNTHRNDDGLFHCMYCSFTTKTYQPGIKRHMITHVSEDQVQMFKCEFPGCTYSTRHKNVLKNHQCVHVKNTTQIFKCDLCDYQSNVKRYLICHRKKHKPVVKKKEKFKDVLIEPVECELCDYKTYYKYGLKSHYMVHEKDKKFECSICSKRFKLNYTLKKHIVNIHQSKDEAQLFECNECDFCTKQQGTLKKHQLRYHKKPEDILVYRCEEENCNFETKVKRKFTRHELEHREQRAKAKLLECTDCDYSNTNSDDFKRHRLLVHGENPDEYLPS